MDEWLKFGWELLTMMMMIDVGAKWAANDWRPAHSSRAETSGRHVHMSTTVSHQQDWRRQILRKLTVSTRLQWCTELVKSSALCVILFQQWTTHWIVVLGFSCVKLRELEQLSQQYRAMRTRPLHWPKFLGLARLVCSKNLHAWPVYAHLRWS